MIRFAHLARRHAEQRIVFAVWCGQEKVTRTKKPEYILFDLRQHGRLDMLDGFNHGGGIKVLKRCVGFGIGTSQQMQPRRLALKMISQHLSGFGKPQQRLLDPDHALKLRLMKQPEQQRTCTAAKIQHPFGTGSKQRFTDPVEALFVQTGHFIHHGDVPPGRAAISHITDTNHRRYQVFISTRPQ